MMAKDSILNTLKLTITAIINILTISIDWVKDLFSLSIPYQTDKILEAKTLTKLINQYHTTDLNKPVIIQSVELLNIPSVSSNCNNIVIEIQQATPTLPQSLFIKLPDPAFVTRLFFSIIESWKLETYFFRHLAANIVLRTPQTYAAASRGSRFILVQENLNNTANVRLFTNLDMLKGPSLDIVYRCLDAFAQLHSQHCDLSRQQQQQLLPFSMHPFLSPTMRTLSKTLNQQGLAPCIKKHPTVIPDPIIDSYKKTLANWEQLLDFWFSGPLSLIHGDSHLGNFFVDGETMGMLDWQAVHWGNGIRDVQYFLTDSLPANTLAQYEQQLVSFYVERRSHYGSAIDMDTTWQQYRSFSYHSLMTIIVSIGFGAMNEQQNALMAEILKRAVAACQRLDYPGWLEEYLSAKAE